VKVLIEDGITIGGKTVKELKETLNHATVLDALDDLFDEHKHHIDQELLCRLHETLMQ
jgi:Fic family protein